MRPEYVFRLQADILRKLFSTSMIIRTCVRSARAHVRVSVLELSDLLISANSEDTARILHCR